MIKWFKGRSRQEKLMLALIAVLLVCVALRWAFIKKEAGDAFLRRLEHFQAPGERTDTPPKTDSVSL